MRRKSVYEMSWLQIFIGGIQNMEKTKLQSRVICFILTLTLLLSMFCVGASAAEDKSYKIDPANPEKNPYSASTLEEMKALIDTRPYEEYKTEYAAQREEYDEQVKAGVQFSPIKVTDILDFVTDEDNEANEGKIAEQVSANDVCNESRDDDPSAWLNFGEENYDTTVYLPSQGYATWSVSISPEQVGFYYIKIEYYSCITSESSISSIERKFRLDDKVPFTEASTLKINKDWVYSNVSTSVSDADGQADSYDVRYELRDEDDGDQGYYKIVTEVKDGKKTVSTYKISQDINGNSMAPESSATPRWSTYYIQDSTGYYDGYFEFYMQEGTRTITLEAEREPMIIKSIELIPANETTEIPTYSEVLEMYKANGYTYAKDGEIIEIQAEFPDLVSDSSVAPSNDNTSAITYPISSNSQLYNVIGETSYNSVGQWAAYKFKVTESGLYNIAMRFKQDALQGMFICRTIKLSGGIYGEDDGTPEVPFKEAYSAEFNYNKKWQSQFVSFKADGSDDYTPMMFYFEEGVEYTVYFECSLGSLKEYIQRVQTSLDKVNACYLEILQLTGSDPDENRDYNFIVNMPDVLITLLEQANELMDVKEGLEALCGTNGSHIATLETIAILLDTMGQDDGREIAANMSTFKSYLGTLGTWVNDSKRSSLMVDSIWITPTVQDGDFAAADEDALPKAKANFFQTLWFEIKSFFSSFFVNYDQMGLTVPPDENSLSIDVWLATGRDQSQIWRTMIDAEESYTSNTGTAVSLKLVTAGTLLPSILSRKGPDVYMGLGSADVINYAIREAVLGISGNVSDSRMTAEENAIFSNTTYTYQIDGEYVTTTEQIEGQTPTFVSNNFEDATEGIFADAAMDTVRLLDVTYGIPITMTFSMMFYRMDVLAELDLEVPETWDGLIEILPVLQTNNMSIGLSYIEALDFMMYQAGGNMWKYTDESVYDSKYAGARVDLDSSIALATFYKTCKYYTDYSFPVSYDASNRFRTGEMPIIIGGYTGIYNTLKVYATEIEGLWEFSSLPGTKRDDGTFNYDSLAYISASVILYGCKGAELTAAWQFLQWHTGEKAQADYGNRMVALIGPSAKYETANLNAIDNLSWTASEKAAILNQMDHMSSIVNYPGSYIITRYIQFAFLDAVNNSTDPIDALTGYIDAMNNEIARKREEFKDMDLWVPESSEDEPETLTP